MIRQWVLQWLFPSCDIDVDIDRENIWNALGKLKRKADSCANF